MHIILGLLGTIVTILILLHRLAEAGVDLGGLNPCLWHRRRKWRKQVEGNPIWRIDDPMEATAVLLVGIAKADGDMSKEDKQLLLRLFAREFHLTKRQAADLLVSSAHILADGTDLRSNVSRFLKPSAGQFSPDQAQSAIELLKEVAGPEVHWHENVRMLVKEACHQLEKHEPDPGTWTAKQG